MAYIGSKPADKVLTASDITDGVVSTAKIADNAVTADKTSYKDVPFRNIIINGDMSQAQRATSTASITGNGYHTIDRYHLNCDTHGTWTQSQDTDVPSGQGFATSMKMDCTTADASPAVADQLKIQVKIEGQMLQHLKKGTANAEDLTLSFWVKSVKTGTYIASLQDSDNTRYISKSYTVDSGSTWEKKEVTFAGDTTGAFNNDNAGSITLEFWLGAGTDWTSGTLATSWESRTNANKAVGQVNLADSDSNNFWITGIQLEVGSSASDFEFLPVDVNLRRCQRYFYPIISISNANNLNAFGYYYSSSQIKFPVRFPTEMRTTPTLSQDVDTDALRFYRDSTYDGQSGNFVLDAGGTGRYSSFYNGTDASGTAGQAGQLYKYSPTQADSYIWYSAEL